MSERPLVTHNPADCVGRCIEQLGKRLVVGAPLALGKPNHLLNALYRAAKADPALELEIFTALSLNPPKPGAGLQRRFLQPFLQRHFGDYPRLEYLADLDAGQVPDNIVISEFYFRSGTRLRNRHAQSHHVSSNYTHVARDMQARGVNVLVQMVGVDPARPGRFSLSSNPDVTLELAERMAGKPLVRLAQINPELPFMGGDAEVPAEFFDMALTDAPQPLFAVPRMPVGDADYRIGLYASALLRDGGTLQLGIGSLGDAVAWLTALRHQDNARYLELLRAADGAARIGTALLRDWGSTEPFRAGLYAASEMFMDGFLHLYDAGVLKRRVYDHAGIQELLNQGLLREELLPGTLELLWQQGLLRDRLSRSDLDWLLELGVLASGTAIDEGTIRCPDGFELANELSDGHARAQLRDHALGSHLKRGALLHAAFFLGSHWMYERLQALPEEERERFRMTRVSRINQLYRSEALDRAQRLHARCVNTTMKATLLGAAVSDQLENGQVVSGVGGQYNFVAMAHALDGGRSLLMLRSWREERGRAVSNIVWEFPHATIPRHLRDIFITEYGVADVRGSSDQETVQKLLCVSDSRWQEELRRTAVAQCKLDPRWRIPEPFTRNTPAAVTASLRPFRRLGWLSDFPNGTDFTPEEVNIAAALTHLEKATCTRSRRLAWLLRSLGPQGRPVPGFQACLERMRLDRPVRWRDRIEQRVLTAALKHRWKP